MPSAVAESEVESRSPPRAVTDAERNAIDDFPCCAVFNLLLLKKLFEALGFANALPSDEVVPNVSRANADDSLIVFSPRCCYLC